MNMLKHFLDKNNINKRPSFSSLILTRPVAYMLSLVSPNGELCRSLELDCCESEKWDGSKVWGGLRPGGGMLALHVIGEY